LRKKNAESDNFLTKFEFKIVGSDGQEKRKLAFEKQSNEFEVGTQWGWPQAVLLTDVFDVQKNYLSENNTLIINMTVSFPQSFFIPLRYSFHHLIVHSSSNCSKRRRKPQMGQIQKISSTAAAHSTRKNTVTSHASHRMKKSSQFTASFLLGNQQF
jgi:hypothetical protein